MNTKLLASLGVAAGTFLTAFAQSDVTSPSDYIVLLPAGSTTPANEVVNNVIDDNTSTKYLNFNILNTGFIVLPGERQTLITGISLTSANDAVERDPSSVSIEGSQDGKTWSLVYSNAVAPFGARFEYQALNFENTNAYYFYRVLFPTVANSTAANSMQIAEVELLGTVTSETPPSLAFFTEPLDANVSDGGAATFSASGNLPNVDFQWYRNGVAVGENTNVYSFTATSADLGAQVYTVMSRNGSSITSRTATLTVLLGVDVTSPTDLVVAWPLDSIVSAAEGADRAIDNTNSTKYLNVRELNTGIFVQPAGRKSTLKGLSITSANDAAERDPSSYWLEGSNDGTTWSTIASNSVPAFTARFQQRAFGFNNTTAYFFYRLTFPTVANSSTANSMQVAEVELLGELSADPALPPLGILAQPQDVVSSDGRTVTFRVTPNQPNTTYQWYRDDAPVASGTNAYAFPVVQADNGADFYVVVGNGSQSVTSRVATLTVIQGLDITTPGDPITRLPEISSPPAAENETMAIDNNTATKYLNGAEFNTGFTVFPSVGQTIVRGLTLTSANDAQVRDPANFILYGSNDGITWSQIVSNNVGVFNSRFEFKAFSFENTTAYFFYRLVFPTVNNPASSTAMQIAEVELIGSTTGNTTKPALQITREPADNVVNPQSVTTFGVAVSQPGATFEWFTVGGGSVANTQIYTLNGVTAEQNGLQAFVVATLDGNSVTSRVATLTVVTDADVTDAGLYTVRLPLLSNPPAGEPVEKLFDNLFTGSKYLNFAITNTGAYIQPSSGQTIVNAMVLTSGNDAPNRDPGSYTIEGSNDGLSWTLISSNGLARFETRNEDRGVSFTNTTPYYFYRVVFPNIFGPGGFQANSMQLSELQLLGTTGPGTTPPFAIFADSGDVVSTNGQTVRFEVAATIPGSTYQWYTNNVAVPNSNTNIYSLAVLEGHNGLVATCEVTNNGTTLTSDPMTLTFPTTALPELSFEIVGNTIEIHWSNGTLESTTGLESGNTWTPVAGPSPYVITTPTGKQFFRVKR